ncbi:MAG: histidine phosphatase family protein [Planctomycetota bacterium]
MSSPGGAGTVGRVLTLVLVRHAATSWNESRYCQGLRDVPLSPTGRRQVALLREALEDLTFDRAYASPLSRAQETANLLGQEPQVIDDLTEIDRGHWEGHPPDEIRRRWGKLARAWYDDPTGLAMPGGEEFDALWERAQRVLDLIVTDGGRSVLACGHKAINRVIIARALGRPAKGVWAIPQPQACRTLLQRGPEGWRAEIIGDVTHLPAELRSDT